MTRTVTGTFKDLDAARNALDDLLAAGFDREKVFLEKDTRQVRVMIPSSIEKEVKEILARHAPSDVASH